MVQHAVLANNGGFANDHAHAVVDEETAADLGPGVDLDTGKTTYEL